MSHVEQRPQGPCLVSTNPATLEVLGETPLAGPEQVRAAVAAAAAAFSAWAATPLARRIEHLLLARDALVARKDEVAALISRENGKPRQEALIAEIFPAADLVTHYCDRAAEVLADREIPLHNPLFRATKSSRLVHEPLGVVSVVSPWNYPFVIPWSGVVFALLAGNTVVLKPASDAVLVGLLLDEILRVGGGLPDGVLNTLVAGGAAMGNALFEPPVRKIVFTGSTPVGQRIQATAARNLIPAVMELGGKDPMIVCADADLELASAGAVWGAFTNAGQVCASVERVYVARPVYQAFVDRVVARTRALRVGPDTDFNVDMGPVISNEQLMIVDEHVREAQARGATALTGGRRVDRPGYFFEPTVLVDVDHTMKVMREETFGPVLPIMPFDTEDEAVTLANDTVFGLTASVWTRDRERGDALATRIRAGTVTINDAVYTYGVCETPWQGMGESGVGRSHSDAGLLEFVYPKHINLDRSPAFLKRRAWWFPYSKAGYETQGLAMKAFLKASALPRFLYELARRKDYRKTLY